MLLTIGFTVAAEDVRPFQFRAIQGARRLELLRRSTLALHRNRARQQIQWCSMSSTLCWSRCADILRLSPGCDGRARVESGECRCPIQASDMQRHAACKAV